MSQDQSPVSVCFDFGKMAKALRREVLRDNKPFVMEAFVRGEYIKKLAPREALTAKYVCMGWSDEKIAKEMNIKVRSVRAVLSIVYAKMDVRDRNATGARIKLILKVWDLAMTRFFNAGGINE